MVVAEKATDPKSSTTMLWVQASALQQQFHQCEVHEKGTEWYYIPRPSLSLPSRTSSRRVSEDSSGKHSWNNSRHSSLAFSTHPGVHGNGGASSSSASSASSQLSDNSGQPLVNAATWLPPHPPALIITKDVISKHDPELGGEIASVSKKCDADSISLASSTHFTMIGGASARGRRRSGCCSHSHRITALVLTMSVIFLVGITVAVILMEMRIKYYNVR
ncbi:uncharacterized protein LOC132195513 [Neocloeon triangulifer]|uniref:uncharacterized protein LOC132195513 n=1 Tax=Neocloeon triangulifer TaxID=2078957 RepID=UPI00286F69B9|nr:uncharacterized protein LOC132195513 [Neocloeon triangulifer]